MFTLLNNRWFLLIILSLTWGSSFILIKKTLTGFDPYQIGAFRVAVSGLLLSFYGLPVIKKTDRKTLYWIFLTGLLGNFLPMFLFPVAQIHVSSAMAGILDSLVPVFVIVFGFVFFNTHSNLSQILGALIGFAGAAVLIIFSTEEKGETQIFYASLVVLATAFYAIAGILVKQKLQHLPSLQLSAAIYSLWMVPSLLILGVSGFFQKIATTPINIKALGYLSFLTIAGTALAMILYYKLIQNTSTIFASTVTYLMPLVAVAWGILDGESFSIWQAVGGLLIILSIYLIREKQAQ